MGMAPLPEFEYFLNNFSNYWIYNDCKLQSIISHYCGHYCVMYCILKNSNYNLLDIVSCFSDDEGLNDQIAHSFVCDI